MSEWEQTRLGEILELITDYHSNGSYETLKANVALLDEEDFAVMIRTTNFEQNNFSNNLKYISKEAYFFLEKSMVFPDDIIMNKIANAGSVYFMPDLQRPVSLAMNLFLIRVNKEKANQRFVFYYLKANEAYVKQFAEGSVTKTITKNAVRNLVIRTPSLEIQNEIVKIIKSVESKIENLKRQNETLEAIAQTLFKHWFIDFEFPNEDGKPYKSSGGAMVRSELGEIPTGWSVGEVGDFCNVRHGYAFKGEFITAEETGQILLTPGNFRIGGGFHSSKYKYYSDDDYDKDYILEAGDLIITMTDLSKEGDTLGYPAFVPKHGNKIFLHNQRLGKVIDSQIDLFFLFFLLCRREYRSHILGTASGSTVRHTSPSRILKCKFTVPNKELLDNFCLVVSKLISKTFANYEQIETLSKTRDVLLPKLISGQLRII